MEIKNDDISKQSQRLIEETQQLGSEVYNEGVEKISDLQAKFTANSEKLVLTVKEKPFTSLLVAAGVGFILSQLMKQ